jgi:histone H3
MTKTKISTATGVKGAFKKHSKARKYAKQMNIVEKADGKRYLPDGTPVKPQRRRSKAGSAAAREVRYLQKTVHNLVPKLPFQRLVREIAQEFKTDLRFQDSALDALHAAAEAYTIELLNRMQVLTHWKGRVTITPQSLVVAQFLKHGDAMQVPKDREDYWEKVVDCYKVGANIQKKKR